MVSLAQTRIAHDPGDPTTSLEESVVLFDRDLGTLSLPGLLTEEARLRRTLQRGGRPSPAICTRLAAVEVALQREGGAQ